MKIEKTLKNGNRKKTTNTMTEAIPHKAVAPKTASASFNGGKTVTIEAKVDVGFGNSLFLRGEGKGLSWNQGIPLTCIDGTTWKWSGEAEDKLRFKLLLNDAVWSQGENLVAAPGQKIQIAPSF